MLVRLLTEEENFCLHGCRSYPQYYRMRKGFEEGRCAFCELDRALNKVLFEDELAYAWVVPEEYKRPELSYHALFVPKRHVRFETDLTDQEVLSLHAAKKALHAQFNYKGGCTHVREGDMRLNAGTVPHLHINTFMVNQTGEVRIPVYKTPDDSQASKDRATEFAQKYRDGEKP
jgi:diadenosine tetraphosphate (Ap4A) HIT family hydrolase